MALNELPLRIEVEQIARDLLDGFAHLALCPVPFARPEPLQLRRRIATADIFLNAIQVLDRHVELVALGVLELHVLALLALVAHQPHAGEAPDPVVDMDDQVAGLELELPGRRARPHHAAADALAQATEEVGVAVNLELLGGNPEALRHRLVAEDDQARGQRRLRPDEDSAGRVDIAILEQLP